MNWRRRRRRQRWEGRVQEEVWKEMTTVRGKKRHGIFQTREEKKEGGEMKEQVASITQLNNEREKWGKRGRRVLRDEVDIVNG